MKKFMRFLFLSCLKATALIEKKIVVRLSVKEKMQLGMHKIMCSACTNYEKQTLLIEKCLHKDADQQRDQSDMDAFKESIKENIKK